jgi:hypothetical protein
LVLATSTLTARCRFVVKCKTSRTKFALHRCTSIFFLIRAIATVSARHVLVDELLSSGTEFTLDQCSSIFMLVLTSDADVAGRFCGIEGSASDAIFTLVLDRFLELLKFTRAAVPTVVLFCWRELTIRACQTSDGSRRILILVLAVGALTARCRCSVKRKSGRTKLALHRCTSIFFLIGAVATISARHALVDVLLSSRTKFTLN